MASRLSALGFSYYQPAEARPKYSYLTVRAKPAAPRRSTRMDEFHNLLQARAQSYSQLESTRGRQGWARRPCPPPRAQSHLGTR
jgi:hypothetical protein